MRMPKGVPDTAEALDALPWIKADRLPSKLVPGLQQLVPCIICPECQTRAPANYCVAFVCKGCHLNLHMETYLYAWRTEPAPPKREPDTKPQLTVVA